MESTEKPIRTILPLKESYFLERVEISRQVDYWLGKAGSDARMYLGSDKVVVIKKAEELMRCLN